MHFDVSADHRVNFKENEKSHKYLDLASELKKTWNMKVMVLPVVIGALGTIPQNLDKEELEIGGRVETIQTTTLARIMRRILEI